MDKQNILDDQKQRKIVETPRKDVARNANGHNFLKLSPSQTQIEKIPSKIKQRSLLQPSKASQNKTPERSCPTAKDGSHKSKKENFSPLEISSPRIPRKLFAANRIPLRSTISKPDVTHSSRCEQLSPTRISSNQPPNSKPKKIRKPIDSDLFHPTNRTEKQTQLRIRKENHLNREGAKDFSELCDWEVIDWPWATPYSPSVEKLVPPDFKLIRISSIPLPESFLTSCMPTLTESQLFGKANQKVNENQDPGSLDGVSTGDQSRSKLYKIPPRRRELTQSDPSQQLSTCNFTVKSPDPENIAQIKDPYAVCELLKDSLNPDENKPFKKSLVTDVSNFVKSISQMNEEDRRSMIGLLDFLNNLQGNEKLWNTVHHEESKDQQGKNLRSPKKELNPDVPDFKPAICLSYQYCEQMGKPLQQRSKKQHLQRKSRSYDLNKEILTKSLQPTNILFDSSIPHVSNLQNNSSSNVIQPDLDPVWLESANVVKEGSDQGTLLKACSNKLDILESLIRDLPVDNGEPLHTLPQQACINSTSQPTTLVPPNLMIDSDGPGRVAHALDSSWAQLMLKRYREKFPKTGIEKEENETTVPIPDKFTVSDLQQRIEQYLLAKKEKEAYQRQHATVTGIF
ncbi:hypothetical protein K3495_g528 [Podosphaera aphanis]|nr:hypothetical protein K3495_g528 [Podosphaera aphanis]